ncbi:tRNA guanosine(34) transglycosylase Tgt [candidate division KSB1 bacterium]|nr:tRNA guanosine(34) transglycosylase Tgt [candidate division KSB1 bacterium]
MTPTLRTQHGILELPAFLPDATRGVVRSLDAIDLERCGIPGLVVNTYHLMLHPGAKRIRQLGGCHHFMNWHKPILTDSGGFQIFSLIHQNPKYGSIRKNEIIFRTEIGGRKQLLTPEKSIRIQANLGADIMVCLDDCPKTDASDDENQLAVARTVAWAKLCKAEFDKLFDKKADDRPLLFAVIQGGTSFDLRRRCAEELLAMGFDGFGFGGWPLDAQRGLLTDTLSFTANLIPDEFPKYAMGIGKPENIAACFEMGYTLFDCALPTRDARHGRLFVFTDSHFSGFTDGSFYRAVYLQDSQHLHHSEPLSDICDCHCCRNYSLAYLHHLYMIGDSLASRLATIHNLRFYSMLMEKLKQRQTQYPVLDSDDKDMVGANNE